MNLVKMFSTQIEQRMFSVYTFLHRLKKHESIKLNSSLCCHILDSMKEERAISPKIEKLSIKNFATVNPAKPASRQPAALKADSIQDGGQKTTGPRRVGFVTIQAKRETQPTAQNSSPPSTTSPVPMATDSTATQSHRVEIDRVSPQQRRVSFVTLTSPQASKNPLVKTAPTVQDEKITQTGTASDSNPSTNNTSSVTTVKNTLTRENRPPVPLEPTVIIINE